MRVLLIIPAYNEQEDIERVIETVKGYIQRQRAFELDYVIINDGSTDNTGAICREKGYNTVHLICNLGIGGAVQTGYQYACHGGYDIAVQFDGDGQHDINSLPDLIAPIVGGRSDVVIGSRFIKGESQFTSSASRRLGIKCLSVLIKLVARRRITDPTSGYRASNAAATAFMARQYPDDYPEPEAIVELAKRGFTIGEVQVNMFERQGGQSSIGGAWRSAYYMIKVSLAILCVSFRRGTKSEKAV